MAALLGVSLSTVQAQDSSSTKDIGVVIVSSGRPSSLPTVIPTTMEGISAKEIQERINAMDSEDVLKYFPSLLVRKRYIGDYNHAMLSSRASGTGNPARSMVFADGMLLSNYLGNSVSGLSFPPRWSMVTPSEIERVDVMYGPYSAAYAGNSAGAVVEFVTRMPSSFEAHAQASYVSQPFDLYNTDQSFRAWRSDLSLGDRVGAFSWLLAASRLDSTGQPQTFATRTLSTGTAVTNGSAVNGAFLTRNSSLADIYVIGTGTQYATVQDHLKLKLAYDLSPTTRISYTGALWRNDSQGRPDSYLTNASTGAPVYSGPIVINGKQFAPVTGGDFALTNEALNHHLHGLSLKTNTKGLFDWELAASSYDYRSDLKRQNAATTTLPAALSGGAGTIARGDGTGWTNLALRGTWRPFGMQGSHLLDFGYQRDQYKLRYLTSSISGNWLSDPQGALASDIGGETRMDSFYIQDTWRFMPRWLAVLGLRSERWNTSEGYTQIAAASYNRVWPTREKSYLSPKAALSYQLSDDSVLKFASGRAVRMPRVQNVGRIETRGAEASLQQQNFGFKGLSFIGSLTFTESTITENAGFVAVAGDTLGKRQPNIPRWRASGLFSYRIDADWVATLGARYSGAQFRTLNNADVNGASYMGVSKFFTVDLRAVRRIDKHWSLALGIDNVNNYQYWNFHPYPQRSY
ncbi:MAG: TonB-dependent receptor, partial [Betaproteobacteria bacterium]|nr:TonB-dependent receptor [Betaproteobacteria bacterium]